MQTSNRWIVVVLALTWMIGTAGCSGELDEGTDGSGSGGDCSAGEVVECACADGSTGQQTCREDGTWTGCSCAADTGADTGVPVDSGGVDADDAAATDGGGGDASWRRPSDDERTLVAKRLDGAVTVDGQLGESAYQTAMEVASTDPSGDSDNRLEVGALWDDEQLVVGISVRDGEIATDADEVWNRDSVEVFVDGEHDEAGEQLDSDDYQMLVDAAGDSTNRVGGPDGRSEDPAFEFEAAVGETDEGYAVEIAVPWEQMSLDPHKGRRMGFLFAGSDRSGGEVASFSWGDVRPFATPSEWGDLRLGGRYPDSEAGLETGDTGVSDDGGDAGTDTGDESDAGPSSTRGCNLFEDPPGSNVVDLGNKGLSDGDTIDPYLDEWVESGNEVHIPAGTYEWNGDGTNKSLENLSIIGDGEVVWETGGGHTWSANFQAVGDVEVRNITVKGEAGNTSGKHGKLRFWAPDGDATLVARNFNQPDGAINGSTRVGIFVPKDHAGEVYFVDCHIEGFSNNGIYGSAPGHGNMGEVHVIRGLYRNNNIANVRLGTDDSSAHGVVSIHDGESGSLPDGGRNQRGIWIRERGDNIRLENLHVTQTYDDTSGAVLIQSRPGGGSGTLQDIHVRNDVSQPAVDITTGNWGGSDIDVTGSNTTVEGDFSDVCRGSGCETPRTEPLPPCADTP